MLTAKEANQYALYAISQSGAIKMVMDWISANASAGRLSGVYKSPLTGGEIKFLEHLGYKIIPKETHNYQIEWYD